MGPAFRRLLPYVLRYRRRFLLGLVCVVLSSTFQLLAPWVLKFAIDDLGRAVTRQKLVTYAVADPGGRLRPRAVPVPDAPHHHRRVARDRIRPPERFLRPGCSRCRSRTTRRRRTGDLMSRATNDLNAVRMMIGPAVMYSASTMLVFAVAIVLMGSIDGAADADRAASAAAGVDQREVLRQRHSPPVRGDPGAALRPERRRAGRRSSGVRVVRAYNQEPYEIERFRAANDEYVRRNRVLIRLQGMFYPEHDAVSRAWVAARAVGRQPRSDPRAGSRSASSWRSTRTW